MLAVGACLKQEWTEAGNLNPSHLFQRNAKVFKKQLDVVLSAMGWLTRCCLDSVILEVFSNLKDPGILNRKQKQHKSFQNYFSADSSRKIQTECLASIAGNKKKKKIKRWERNAPPPAPCTFPMWQHVLFPKSSFCCLSFTSVNTVEIKERCYSSCSPKAGITDTSVFCLECFYLLFSIVILSFSFWVSSLQALVVSKGMGYQLWKKVNGIFPT